MEQNNQSRNPKTKRREKLTIQEKRKNIPYKIKLLYILRVIIIHKSTHSLGSHHDYKIYKSKHPTLSQELLQFYDPGYLGIKKDFPNQISILPYKKKKGKELTIHKKEWNKLESKIRIKVEHIIAQIKKFRINRDVFRNKLCR